MGFFSFHCVDNLWCIKGIVVPGDGAGAAEVLGGPDTCPEMALAAPNNTKKIFKAVQAS